MNKLIQESKFAGKHSVGLTYLQDLIDAEHDDKANQIIKKALQEPAGNAQSPQQTNQNGNAPPPNNNPPPPMGKPPNSSTCCLI